MPILHNVEFMSYPKIIENETGYNRETVDNLIKNLRNIIK